MKNTYQRINLNLNSQIEQTDAQLINHMGLSQESEIDNLKIELEYTLVAYVKIRPKHNFKQALFK